MLRTEVYRIRKKKKWPLPAHDGKRQLMVPEGPVFARMSFAPQANHGGKRQIVWYGRLEERFFCAVLSAHYLSIDPDR